jgi:thymidylate synthase (FAD)
MKVKLISYTQPSKEFYNEVKIDNIQELVVYCARISNPSNQLNTGSADKLIKYLIKHQHWSVFEMVSACLEIETTRDIARQMLRHRSFSFQEFSQRYADPTKDLSFVTREARFQDTKNRQNSTELDMSDEDNRFIAAEWEYLQRGIIEQAKEAYTWAIAAGIAKEQARAVLPEGLTASRMYVNGTLRSWIHYIQVRSDTSTQKEHRLIAVECAKIIAEIFPLMNEIYSNQTT